MSKSLDVYKEFEELIDALNSAGVDYALCGGLAVIIYGYARSTTDIDILIRQQDLDAVRKVAIACGFDIESGCIPFNVGKENEYAIHRMLKFVDDVYLVLDLMFVEPLYGDIWEKRGFVEVGGRRIQVISKEGLAEMKKEAGRKQDLADLDRLGLLDNGKEND